MVGYNRIMVQSSPHSGSGTRLPPKWPTCDHEAAGPCTGVRVDGFGQCLTHLAAEQLDETLSRLHPSTDLDVRGTTLSSELLVRIVDAMRDDEGHPRFGQALFSGATFTGAASFDGATFTGTAWFDEVTFMQWVSFRKVTFTGGASFDGATFTGTARFDEVTFMQWAAFDWATFRSDVSFHKVTFTGIAWFKETTFIGGALFRWGRFSVAWFDEATFMHWASFDLATFTSIALFGKVTFTGVASFDMVTCTDQAYFKGTTFEMTESFGPVAARTLTLARVLFSKHVVIQLSAEEFDCNETRFEAGAVLRGIGTTALTSLQGVDVMDLVVTDIDLSSCRFAGARHLDKLRLEGDCQFARPPKGIQLDWRWPPVWRWTRRQVLAEECDLRAAGPKSGGWPALPSFVTPLNAKRVGALYRDLRKAQEDSKNEPGADDFRYGEMEMRRADRTTPWSERLIPFVYWLLSGYGLRPARALGWLAALVAAASVALHVVGFADPRQSLSTCLLYAAESVVPLEPKLAGLSNLTWQGETVRLGMRLVGWGLLALAFWAARNRVKR